MAPTGKLIDGWDYIPGFHNASTLPLRHELFDERDALLFTELKSRSVKLVHRDSRKGLNFEFPKMEVLAVWSKPHANADYVCLEPWHGIPECVGESGNMEDKPFVTLLAPGHCYKTWFTVTLI